MATKDDATIERKYATAYAAMATFEDGPREVDQILSDFPLEEQFRIDLVLWTVERLRRFGLAVDAAWLLHELLVHRARMDPCEADMDTFVRHVILHELAFRLWLDLQHEPHTRNAFARITDTVEALLESVE